MLEFVVGNKAHAGATDALLEDLREIDGLDGTVYVGYPLLLANNDLISVDSMLVTRQHGVVLFDLLPPPCDYAVFQARQAHQNELFLTLSSQLMRHPELCAGRNLKVPIEIVTYVPTLVAPFTTDSSAPIAFRNHLQPILAALPSMDEPYYRPLNAAVQHVSNLKPAKRRQSVRQQDSRGAALKEIEKAIANLDRNQKRGAIECPEGPQRIRGLAGSGKTIVLALKAAYLHSLHPEWDIAVTFHTRSLYGQFQDLIRRFTFEHSNDEPDWTKLRILHSWGAPRNPGLYSEIARHYGMSPKDFGEARAAHGRADAFRGVCDELATEIASTPPRDPMFDAVLIDEAQDLPASFFRMVYAATATPKRIVWAYDELQNLGSYEMLPPSALFGLDSNGVPLVQLRNTHGEAHQDVILPVCYRNTPWALATAHALGFGIYRQQGLVQLFDDLSLWSDIGYEVCQGTLAPGHDVSLRRQPDCSPSFFANRMNSSDAVELHIFNNDKEQAQWVAESIERNLKQDELEISDILVIVPDPITVQRKASVLIAELQRRSIRAHIAGVTTSRDEFFSDGSVAISGIYRAKGNEAPMVYLVGAEDCYAGPELIRKRNTLFTAITRSRAWVRICGCGPSMERLRDEFEGVVARDFRLEFRVPTDDELQRLRRIHRDMTVDERKRLTSTSDKLADVVDALESGELDVEHLSPELLTRLRHVVDLGEKGQ